MVISKSRNVGIFAELTTTIRHIKKAKENNHSVNVKWSKNDCLYYDESIGDNVWEYYFDQIDSIDASDMIIMDDYIPITNIDGMNIRETFNHVFNTYIKLNENTHKIIKESLCNIDNNTLGLHIRKTDKFNAINFNEPMAYPIDDNLVFDLVDSKLESYNKIFLATDCIDTYNAFKSRYKDIMIDNDDVIRGKGLTTIHTSDNSNGYKKGLQALIDSYMLSKCGFLIRSTSNLSSFSMFLNLDLECININELYRNDIREHEFNIYSKH